MLPQDRLKAGSWDALALLDRIPLGLLRTSPDGRILQANAALVRMLGYPDRATLLARSVYDLYANPADRARLMAQVGQGIQEFELHWRGHGGGDIWVRALIWVIAEGDGRVLAYEGSLEDVTERRQLEQERQIAAAALEATANGVVITDREGRVEWVNPAFTAMTGYAASEVIGQSPRILKSGQHGPSFYLDLWATILSGRVWHGKVVNRRKDGTLSTEEMTITPVRNAEGVIEHFVAVKHDASEHERSREALRRSEEYHRALIEHALDIVAVLNEDGTYRYASPAIERILGYWPGDIVGTNAFDQIHPEDVHRIRAIFEPGRKGPAFSATAQYRVRHRDGTWRVLEATGSNLLEVPAVRGIIVNARDVTERQRAAEALAESERRYRLLAENVSDVIWIRDLDLKMTYVSPSAGRLRGYSVEEVMAQSVAEAVTPGSLEPALALLREALELERQGRIGPFESRTVELEMPRKDGSTIWTESKISFVRDASGRAVGLLGVARDISARKRAEETERQLQSQLARSEKLAAMGALLAGVAHELNNPLSVVVGYATMVQALVKDSAVARQIEKIRQAAERCARIVKNFVMLGRQHAPESTQVDLNRLVQETLEMLAYPLRIDNIEVVFELGEGMPFLWADPHQLQQVITNLVINAHYAMRESGQPRRLTIATDFDPRAARASLAITDTGRGISPEVQQRLFEPFFTTKPVGQGTGLGLSICKGIVEGHGGTIAVDGRLGHGARVTVTLPVGAPGAEAEPAVVVPALAGSGRTVLVVDDEREVAEVVADTLALDGFGVTIATAATEALGLLDRTAFDVILTDIRMPGMDGPGLYREVMRRRPELVPRLVFVTGDVLNPVTLRFLEETHVPHLSKPFDRTQALAVIGKVLHSRSPSATHPSSRRAVVIKARAANAEDPRAL